MSHNNHRTLTTPVLVFVLEGVANTTESLSGGKYGASEDTAVGLERDLPNEEGTSAC